MVRTTIKKNVFAWFIFHLRFGLSKLLRLSKLSLSSFIESGRIVKPGWAYGWDGSGKRRNDDCRAWLFVCAGWDWPIVKAEIGLFGRGRRQELLPEGLARRLFHLMLLLKR
jgi:hypothetical protein